MALPNNQTGSINGVTQYRRATYFLTAAEATANRNWLSFNDETDVFGYYNYPGSPEGQVAANIGSYCSDTSNGNLYVKKTDTVNTGWSLLQAGPDSPLNFTADDLTSTQPIGNNINIFTLGEASTTTAAGTVDVLAQRCAKIIVDPTQYNGTHQTITAAMAAASSGDTIILRPGTYTENYTHKPGVNVVAFMGDDDIPNVTLNGQITYTGSGIASIGNIRLQTNSDFFLVVSGSNASVFYLNNCTLNCSNNTGISYTNSNAASAVLCYDCDGNIGTTGISLYSSSSAGTLRFYECAISNTGMSTTASNNSAGTVVLTNTTFGFPISTTSTGGIISLNTFIAPTTAAIAVTHAGSTQSSMTGGGAIGLTQSAISVGSGALLALNLVDISSSNTNAITGAGTVAISGLTFSGSSSTINTTTQTRNVLYGGAYKGRAVNTTPPAGMIGESISSFIPTASSITLSSPTASNVTSISLTPGIWDVSAICAFSGAVTGTVFVAAISTVSATLGTSGDNQVTTPTAPTALSDNIITIPRYRIELSATTTVYLVALGGFTVGTLKAYGRLSATRVA